MNHYLNIEVVENSIYVKILKETELIKVSNINNCETFRFSPIFPVIVNNNDSILPNISQHYYIGFFYLYNPYSTIARLLNSIEKKYHPNLWFSHGLASLIVFSNDIQNLKKIENETKINLRAIEIWEINNNKYIKNKYFVFKKEEINFNEINIDIKNDFLPELKGIIDEFNNSLSIAVHKSSIYLPNHIERFLFLKKEVEKIVNNLNFLDNPSENPPEDYSDYEIENLKINSVERQKRIHRFVGDLVQINSAISYVISQAFSGTIPILKHESQIRTYSLLGVGTAINALSSFTKKLENIFQKKPLSKIISNLYSNFEAINPFIDLKDFQPEEWKKHRPDFNILIESIGLSPIKPTMVFFSGRLGFRESLYSVSAAIQLLTSVNSSCWSMMTLSHELLHSHVRSILGAIFTDENKRPLNIVFPEYYIKFKKSLDSTKFKNEKLLDSIRSIILNFCRLNTNFKRQCNQLRQINDKQKEEESIIFNDTIPDLELSRNELSNHFKEINEIIVQILDYYYLYNANEDIYISLLWESWEAVPIVLEKIDHYILRSIITIASKQKGKIDERFNKALKLFIGIMEKIVERNPKNLVSEYALKIAQTKNRMIELSYIFQAGLYLADMTKYFFRLPKIYTELFIHDEYFTSIEDGEFQYNLQIGEFSDTEITSPVAFIFDCLRKSLTQKKTNLNNHYVSSWIFLVCSSYIKNEKEEEK